MVGKVANLRGIVAGIVGNNVESYVVVGNVANSGATGEG